MVIRAGEGLAVSTFISHGYFKNLSTLPASVIDWANPAASFSTGILNLKEDSLYRLRQVVVQKIVYRYCGLILSSQVNKTNITIFLNVKISSMLPRH